MSVPATDNLFWVEVIEGYNQVAIENTKTIKVARDGKEATIHFDYEWPKFNQIRITIKPVNTETVEPLPVP